MLEMVKEAEYELLHYPKRSKLKRGMKTLAGRKQEPAQDGFRIFFRLSRHNVSGTEDSLA